jgi:hypothetical protein
MKKFTIPQDVQLRDPITDAPVGKTISFKEFMILTVLSDPEHFGKDAAAVDAYIELKRLFKGAQVGETCAVENEYHERLVRALTSPSRPWLPDVVAQARPFADAVTGAT